MDGDLVDMLRKHGYGNHEGFCAAADLLGITPSELSDFVNARTNLSRLEITRIPWVTNLADILECTRSNVIETYRDKKWGGWAYLIYYEDEYKIGRTRNLRDRFQEFRYQYKGMIEIHTIRTNESLFLEKSLHRRYQEFNTHGEWFVLPQAEIEILRSVKRVQFKPLLSV